MFSSFAVMSAVRFRASLQNHPESLTMRRMQAIFTNASAEGGRDLVALAQFFSIAQPSEGSFHNPALGQRLKTTPLTALGHLHVPAEYAQRPIDQTARVALKAHETASPIAL